MLLQVLTTMAADLNVATTDIAVHGAAKLTVVWPGEHACLCILQTHTGICILLGLLTEKLKVHQFQKCYARTKYQSEVQNVIHVVHAPGRVK